MIRPAIKTDLSKIIQVTQACAKHLCEMGIFQWNENYPSLEAFEKDLSNEELFVLEIEGDVIGAIVISTRKDDIYEPIDWLTEDSTNGYLHRLCVHPKHQGKGHARTLLDFAETYLKELGAVSVRLDTFSKNLRNNKLYEARGYRRLGDVYFEQKSPFPFHCYEKLL
jgi:ribosomal protein S18 acetylase RimI-like enzyme